MAPERVDGNGVPIIVAVNAKIGALERRLGHLETRIRTGCDPRGHEISRAALEWDRSEAEALHAAVRALKFHSARLVPEWDPVVALDKLITAASAHLTGNLTDDEMVAHIKRAAVVLAEAA